MAANNKSTWGNDASITLTLLNQARPDIWCSEAGRLMMHYSSADNKKNGEPKALHQDTSVIGLKATPALLSKADYLQGFSSWIHSFFLSVSEYWLCNAVQLSSSLHFLCVKYLCLFTEKQWNQHFLIDTMFSVEPHTFSSNPHMLFPLLWNTVGSDHQLRNCSDPLLGLTVWRNLNLYSSVHSTRQKLWKSISAFRVFWYYLCWWCWWEESTVFNNNRLWWKLWYMAAKCESFKICSVIVLQFYYNFISNLLLRTTILMISQTFVYFLFNLNEQISNF